MNKKIVLLLLGFLAAAWNATPANAITGTSSIDNEDFTLSPANLGLNNADGNSTINTTANPDGFNSQFDTTGGNTFLLLGADDPNSIINAGTNTGLNNTNVTATSSPFNISAGNVSDGFVNFEFDWSFQGNNDTFDSFFVALAPTGGNPSTLLIGQSSYGSGTFNSDVDVSGLTPGDYDFVVSLTESTFSGNSAAGFDNISVSEVPVAVPFGVSPNMGFFILGGLYAGSSYCKRRKMSK